MLRSSNFAFNTALWTVSSHTVLSFWIQRDIVIGAVSAFFVTCLHLFYFVFVVNWLWLRLQVTLSLSLYFVVQLSKVVFVQNFPSYVGIGVLLTVRCVCVCVYVSHTHTYIVHDLQMEIRMIQKNSVLFFFYCILAYYKSQDKFRATEHTLHIVKIYQKGILYYLYQIGKERSPNRSNGKISYRFYESNTANHTTLDDRKTKICDSTRRWVKAANAEVIITELSYIYIYI